MIKHSFILYKLLILIFSLLLQISATVLTFIRPSDYFVVFYTISISLSIVTVLLIVSLHINPAYKIAWIIIILLFPYFGVALYLLLYRAKNNSRIAEQMTSIEKDIKNILPPSDVILALLKKDHPEAYRQAYYIKNTSHYPIYNQSNCAYYSPGEVAFSLILNELNSAENFIFLEYFIIESGLFWDSILEILIQKVNKGIDVRLIYDDVGSVFRLPRNYSQYLQSQGIKCERFHPIKPFDLSKLNNRDHRKILIIDGKIAFTGGINLADEYINVVEKHGNWKDSVLSVKGDAVWSFMVMFLSTWSNLTKSKIEYDNYQIFPIPKEDSCGLIQPFCDTPMDNECVSEAVYLNLINLATKYIYITTPYLIISNEIETALCIAAKSGIDVRIITPSIPDNKFVHMNTRTYYSHLIENGVKIFEYTPGFMHSKIFLVDDIYAVIGSINLDYRSLYLHYECGVFMYRAICIEKIKKDFDDSLAKSSQMHLEALKEISFHRKLLGMFLRIFAPLF